MGIAWRGIVEIWDNIVGEPTCEVWFHKSPITGKLPCNNVLSLNVAGSKYQYVSSDCHSLVYSNHYSSHGGWYTCCEEMLISGSWVQLWDIGVDRRLRFQYRVSIGGRKYNNYGFPLTLLSKCKLESGICQGLLTENPQDRTSVCQWLGKEIYTTQVINLKEKTWYDYFRIFDSYNNHTNVSSKRMMLLLTVGSYYAALRS